MTPTMDGSPDLEGFAQAQRRLREKLGRVVKFYTPIADTYDPALPSGAFDPDTGEPYDPTNRPVSSGWVVASSMCSVVYAPLSTIRRDEIQAQSEGVRSRLNKDLILDVDDYWVASGATMYELDGEFWKIVNVKADGIGSKQRYIVFGQDRSGDGSDYEENPTTGSDSNDGN
jgi:hypothetical protein